MLKFSKVHFELLKKELASTAGLSQVAAADCKTLSNLIARKTGQRLSETTLKRIFGFTISKFNPSVFTLNVLATFCGTKSWADFCKVSEHGAITGTEKNSDWKSLRVNAGKITSFTIQTLKNRSVIPYKQTIKRSFVDNHISEFLASGCPGTIISAPAGYGKTIALCNWIEEQTELENINENNDLYLFFSCSALMSVLLSGRDIGDWILALLGYSADKDLDVLFDIQQRKEGKFFLVIDGLDEHTLKSDQFHLILDQVINILSLHKQNDWFKLILTMRSATWINYRHELDNGANMWYTGFNPCDGCINVPLFSIREIRELCKAINPSVQMLVSDDTAEIFNHPLYFQLYYKQHKENFTLNNVDNFCVYEIISTFILNKIYLGQHSAEKIILIKELIDLMDFERKNYTINKLKVNNLLKQYASAYQELLSIGFLAELNESDNYHYNTYISFANVNFLVHSIAKNLLYNNGDNFDSALIERINSLLVHSPHKLAVLQWCIIHAIKTGQQESFSRLTEIRLTVNEKSELLIFLGNLLEKEYMSLKRNESLMLYFKQDFSEKMFNYFFGLELINSSYNKTLKTLVKFELANRKKILVYTALGINALINLNIKELEFYIGKLKAFSVIDFQSFAVNPLSCLDALYHYLKFGTIKRDILVQLTKLSFNSPEDSYNLKNCASNDMLYLLGSYTMLIAGNPKKSMRLINAIGRTYKNIDINSTSQYGFFIKILMADFYFRMGELNKVSEIYWYISDNYEKGANLLTSFMWTTFYTLKIKHLIASGNEDEVINEMRGFSAIVQESGSKLSKLYIFSLLLKREDLLERYPNFNKQVRYEFIKLIRDNEIHANELFEQVNDIIKN